MLVEILIADDEPLERELLLFAMEKLKVNCSIKQASHGQEVIDMMMEQDFDLILMDIRMPKVDGLTASCEVKKRNPKTEIIIISAYGDFQYAQKAIQSGVSDYILKPFELHELIEKVSKAIQRILAKREEDEKISALRLAVEESIPFLRSGLVKKLLSEQVINEKAAIAESSYHPIIRQCKDIVAQSYTEPLTLNIIAEKLHVNPSYLSRLFKKIEKINFIDYLIQYRLNQAKVLLSSSDYSIDQIAADTGFGTHQYFSTLFRKREGMCPSEYRSKRVGGL